MESTSSPIAIPGLTLRGRAAEAEAFRVKVHHDVLDLPASWPRSGATGEALCHVFQTAEFLKSWVASYGARRITRTFFVEVHDADGALVMLAPFALVRKRGVRILSFIDAGASDYNAPILFPAQWTWTQRTAESAWAAIKAALPPFDIAMFDKMPVEVGGRLNPFHLLSDGPNGVSGHMHDLRKSWAEIEATQPFMKTLQKKTRQLEKIAPTKVIVAETREERDALVAKLLEQKQRRFEETMVPGFEEEPEKRDFVLGATEAFAETGALHLTALTVGEEIVATIWGLKHEKRFYGLVIGFGSGQWQKYSTGRILYQSVLRTLFDTGFQEMDVGVGDEPWKLDHCDVTIPLSRKTEAATMLGRCYVAGAAIGSMARESALWKRLRPYKWVVLRSLREMRAQVRTEA